MVPWVTSLQALSSPIVHQIAAIACTVIIFRAVWPGLRRHADARIESFATVGLSLLLIAAFVLPAACCDELCRRPDGSAVTAGVNWSHSLVSATAIRSYFGSEALSMIHFAQSWMTPAGGLLIAIAHGLNLRNRVR